jgi:hypothetical protein
VEEAVWILFDFTVRGSAKNCLVAARSGIFYHHMNATPYTFAISYESLRDAVIVDRFWGGVMIGKYAMTFSGGNNKATCDFLRSLQDRLRAIPH